VGVPDDLTGRGRQAPHRLVEIFDNVREVRDPRGRRHAFPHPPSAFPARHRRCASTALDHPAGIGDRGLGDVGLSPDAPRAEAIARDNLGVLAHLRASAQIDAEQDDFTGWPF
jgi:hypothetical protein